MSWHEIWSIQRIGTALLGVVSDYPTDLVDAVDHLLAIRSLGATPRVSIVGYVLGESWTNDKMLADLALLRPSCLA